MQDSSFCMIINQHGTLHKNERGSQKCNSSTIIVFLLAEFQIKSYQSTHDLDSLCIFLELYKQKPHLNLWTWFSSVYRRVSERGKTPAIEVRFWRTIFDKYQLPIKTRAAQEKKYFQETSHDNQNPSRNGRKILSWTLNENSFSLYKRTFWSYKLFWHYSKYVWYKFVGFL